MENSYLPLESCVEEIVQETPTIKTFVLRPQQAISFVTGQFIEVTLPGEGEAPFTPSSDQKVKDKLEVTIMKAGRITEKLHTLEKGAILGIRGPFGNGYPLEKFRDKEILIIGGGVGLAPLRSLLYALLNEIEFYKKLVLRYGAKTPADLLYKTSLPLWGKEKKIDLVTTVDVGDASWRGNVGLVTNILKDLPLDLRHAIAVVCGPPIMMKFVTLKLLEIGFQPPEIYLSMEKNMSCGLGKCGHCRMGKFYVCKDGPVFTYEQIKEIPDIWA